MRDCVLHSTIFPGGGPLSCETSSDIVAPQKGGCADDDWSCGFARKSEETRLLGDCVDLGKGSLVRHQMLSRILRQQLLAGQMERRYACIFDRTDDCYSWHEWSKPVEEV